MRKLRLSGCSHGHPTSTAHVTQGPGHLAHFLPGLALRGRRRGRGGPRAYSQVLPPGGHPPAQGQLEGSGSGQRPRCVPGCPPGSEPACLATAQRRQDPAARAPPGPAHAHSGRALGGSGAHPGTSSGKKQSPASVSPAGAQLSQALGGLAGATGPATGITPTPRPQSRGRGRQSGHCLLPASPHPSPQDPRWPPSSEGSQAAGEAATSDSHPRDAVPPRHGDTPASVLGGIFPAR